MAQICRINKFEVPVLIRILHGICGCSKRHQSNYYKILRIPQNATQKEIREAFITLSKEMHPDSGNKGNHNDFIKLKEAYSVLCKKDSRYYYDINLNSNGTTNCNSDFQYNGPHNFYSTTECQTKRPAKEDLAKAVAFCIIIMIFGGVFQVVGLIMLADYKRHRAEERNARYEVQYQSNKELRKKLLELEEYNVKFPDE